MLKIKRKRAKRFYLILLLLFTSVIFLVVYITLNPKKTLPSKARLTTPTPILTREAGRFKLNGQEISPFGVRVANALASDYTTDLLISNLEQMKSYGIQSISFNLQGARFYMSEDGFIDRGNVNSFTANGDLKSEYTIRVAKILNKLAEKNMVGVVSYYYQGHDEEFENETAILNAARNATNFLKPWRNVWLYVINEYYVPVYDYQLFRTVEGQTQIYNAVKETDPERITYVSDEVNDGFIARTGTTQSNGNVVIEYKRRDAYWNPGVFTEYSRYITIKEAEETSNNGGYWFYHAAWHQAVVKDEAGNYSFPRFDRGGNGTPDSPGVSFIWSNMKKFAGSRRLPIYLEPPNPTPTPTPASLWRRLWHR